jgi:hypothetical protein
LLAESYNKIGLKTLGFTAKYEGKRLRKPGKGMPTHRIKTICSKG